jgi:23S rRNA (pseudouridine1915-N3)-methyltransferase
MQINLIAVGKRMPKWVELGYQEYAERLPNDYKLNLIEINLIKRTKAADISRIIQQEGDAILAAIPKNNFIIALSEKGEQLNTLELASQLQHWHDQPQNISLLIGGPDGLSQNCLKNAQKNWSLSKLTFPHPLVRIIVAEQIYRAWSVTQHHPYHR